MATLSEVLGSAFTGNTGPAGPQGVQGPTGPSGPTNGPFTTNAKSTSYTLASGDVGELIIMNGGTTVTIPANVFSAGDAISIYSTAASMTISASSVTARFAGSDTTATSFALSQYGVATVLCVGTNTFVVLGTGVA